MAYTKQTWTDDVSAVTGARMTHIEDGIYDNSTNIDTINNNVNPSGTATTTQTDFTEGQLTQKLGLKYIKIKGQTSQATRQGYNLIGVEGGTVVSPTYSVTTNISGDVITINGSRDDSSTSARIFVKEITNIGDLTNGTYKLLLNKISGSYTGGIAIIFLNNGVQKEFIQTSNGEFTATRTLTFSETIDEIRLVFLGNFTANNFKFQIMLQKGTSELPYEQYGASPSPDFPQDVEVVKGSNALKVCNKNLIDITCSNQSNRGINLTNNNNGTVTLNGTATATSGSLSLFSSNTSVPVSSLSGTITFSTKEALPSGVELALAYGDSTGTWISNIARLDSTSHVKTATISPPSNAVYLRANFSITNGTAINNLVVSPQIEIGSTATSFIAHREEDYEINLGKNLFNKDDSSVIFNGFVNGSTSKLVSNANSRTICMPCKANTTYTISKIISGRFVTAETTSSTIAGDISVTVNSQTTSTTSHTITTSASAKYILVFYYLSSADTLSEEEIRDSIQIEVGSQATSYASYFTPIELCKIGTYQDYIYKNNGKWYLHNDNKLIKPALQFSSAGQTNCWYSAAITDYKESDNIPISSHFQGVTNVSNAAGFATATANMDNAIAFSTSTGTPRFYVKSSLTQTELNNLFANGVDILYKLKTPTEEEITYEPLIRQLDKLDKIGLYDISNISQENSDMKMLLDFTICNDNYNGLKEFIRA